MPELRDSIQSRNQSLRFSDAALVVGPLWRSANAQAELGRGMRMTRQEALQKLETIKRNSLRVLRLLEEIPRTSESDTEIRDLTVLLKTELQTEYERMLPESVQRKLSMFGISVYSPTIEETWKGTGISRLKTDGVINGRWSDVLESIVYNTSKYIS